MKLFKTACLAMIALTFLCGVVYPFFMTGVGYLFFRKEAQGSLLMQNGRVVGSEWIGQAFTGPQYFHPRPSAAGDKGYDAANSSASNLGPTSQKLVDTLKQRIAAYRLENKLALEVMVPAEAVTSSGSGLDPHISLADARLQLPRVAAARGLSEAQLKILLKEYTEGRTWGLFGERRVHVLRLNLELDQI